MILSFSSTVLAVNATVLSIVNLAQSVAALLGNLAAFNSTYASTLIATIELIKADVAALPLTTAQQNEIIIVLNEAENIINTANAAGAITIEQINSILNLLQLAIQKINVFIAPFFFGPLQKGCFRGPKQTFSCNSCRSTSCCC
ncbi:hypothetical protein EDC14_10375 [Hydrogenispora ethanolica]|uniref:Uncharacterized protein n=1 Tax=Hydrogenispora ethanolica TaxID=1082276 RepID=A0A4R1R333_HYDET|nr:hypothetical protein [Hydrogenispora ethanolica]TCL59768.1 hypothetical protein EDC14_10375 [Hydrogenispora ethanolica]